MDREEYIQRAFEFAARGERIGVSKLTEDNVRYIRRNPEGKTARQLALDFGVHYRTIEKVRQFETWTHVA